jgi:selenocysteine lyase/cysteine desulfurase
VDQGEALVERVRREVVGDGQVLTGPFGPRRVTYADWTASGRALGFVEDAIRGQVLPWYANTHTESSGTGRHTTRLREQARQVIHQAVGGTDQDLVIFCGSGATAAVAKLVGLLELGGRGRAAAPGRRPVVLVGPFEHHSNLLPWRESAAEVVAVGEDANGQLDLAGLEARLARLAGRPLVVGSFSAASNVTGILTDVDRVAALLHRHGALSVWDYSAAAPYVPIRMAESRPGAGDHKDAVVFSPHKLVGGPQTPGVLVVRRDLARNRVPTVPGGGTVAFVDPVGHRYLDDPVGREEGGTPGIVESIRAGLVVALKQAVGTDLIQEREQRFLRLALDRWRGNPNLELLGNLEVPRLPIVSFRIRHGHRYLHHELVVAMLNDLFGIQARGGCSCAGRTGTGSSASAPTGRGPFASRPTGASWGSSPAGCGSASTGSSATRSPVSSSTRSTCWAGTGTGYSATMHSPRAAATGATTGPLPTRPCPWPACSTARRAPSRGRPQARTPWPATSTRPGPCWPPRPRRPPSGRAGCRRSWSGCATSPCLLGRPSAGRGSRRAPARPGRDGGGAVAARPRPGRRPRPRRWRCRPAR